MNNKEIIVKELREIISKSISLNEKGIIDYQYNLLSIVVDLSNLIIDIEKNYL